ncbi:tRNA (adenosine(37)-N6)-threonylcarbamoyltransferase complex dimerization subunit type 1 TsaB [Lactiplantibacillus paraplantarum]|uniref:tRNA (Adenosine(37)-N6)-threonylcarbamoyltransferase complex dimerization subunit type 1 TsaB n=1 Tax=Lactiplantibacillus paraplantarum TaxID=60520 RepID=A0A098R688_9LACO|nr:tRNA (adenosine(37)-N6)-threonylcarbamoyltransferase complex dimerization subunit type 1 TsaB [Lactiplantibacillus paraplantarum]OAX76778.1 tRNA threonylcarbamoyladenosine biosynthesis protein TsaB [Lactiplantibacillus plantarum]ALO03635.1 tRNA threonylcarbamoyladenosine biosynthesis protein TsaB [Lactiplantibacillus paraplantarum]AVW09602.1 tRNA (adenosine(37)-N6)-threonylcarbamoyltransferase complex dimerization subunit type 1 TsaB [Lactiplantibacillus paraplantarum]AYJ37816.1 tRNA (adenos
MKLLAIDTSNRPLSVAVLEDTRILATTTTNVGRNHSSTLLPIIEQAMAQAQVVPNDLDRIVVAAGPGSYTGLRIGVTTAKTLAFTLNKALVGVSSLAVLAGNIVTEGQLVAPLFDARRDNIFTGLYRIEHHQPVTVIADQHISVAEWGQQLVSYNEPITFIGSDVDQYTSILQTALPNQFVRAAPQLDLPQAAVLGLLGQTMTPVAEIHNFVPNYLRLTQAEREWQAKHPEKEHAPYVEKI